MNLYDAKEFEKIAERLYSGATVEEALEGVPVIGTIEIEEKDLCPHCGRSVEYSKFHGCCSQECWWSETEDTTPTNPNL